MEDRENPEKDAHEERSDPSFGFDDSGERVWRHPSEIGAVMAAANGVSPVPVPRNRHTVGLISLGASLALLAVTIVSFASPGPDSSVADQLARVNQSATIETVLYESEVATTPNDTTPLRSHEGVMRVERWGGGRKGQGNGVMIFDDGYIATSRALVAGATQVLVHDPVGNSYKAKIVGGDFILDIAVLKIDAPDLAKADMANDDPERGDMVHVADTWTNEVVSTRVLGVDEVVADRNGFHRQELVEYAAAVGPFAEGAPVMNDDDQVVAMVVPIDHDSAFNYALDINAVRLAAHQIIETGFVNHVAWIGIKGKNLDPGKGVRVETVVGGSPADAAGLQVDDVIITIARHPVSSLADLHDTLGDLAARQVAQIEVVRDGKTIKTDITLGLRAKIK